MPSALAGCMFPHGPWAAFFFLLQGPPGLLIFLLFIYSFISYQTGLIKYYLIANLSKAFVGNTFLSRNLLNLIPKYSMFLIPCNWYCFKILFSNYSLLVYRNLIKFYMLCLCITTLLSSFISTSSSFIHYSKIVSIVIFIISFPLLTSGLIYSYFFYLLKVQA